MSVKDELQQIATTLRERGVNLEADAVVEAARDAVSYPALHKALEWDDQKAAHKWRVAQAHQLIIRCRITVEEGEALGLSIVRPIKMFPHMRDQKGYVELSEVTADQRLLAQWLAQLRADISRASATLRDIEGLLDQPAREELKPMQRSLGNLEAWLDRRRSVDQPSQSAAG